MELLKYIPTWFSRSCCVLETPEGNTWMCDECVMHKDCIWLNFTIFILLYQDFFFLEYFLPIFFANKSAAQFWEAGRCTATWFANLVKIDVTVSTTNNTLVFTHLYIGAYWFINA